MPVHATHVTLDPAGVLRTLVLQEPEHPDITLTLRGTAQKRCSITGGSGQPPTTGYIDQWPATATSTRSCNPRKLPRNIPDSSVADRRRVTGRRETVPAGSIDVGGWRHTDSRMPSDKLPPVAVDRRGTNVDEAVAFYEDVYASQDIHIGKPTADGFTWRYRAVGDDDKLTLGTSAVDANRWGTIGQHGAYILAWTTTPGIVLDVDTRDAIAMPPNVPVMYPSGRPFEFNAAPGTQHMIRFDGTFLENVAAAQLGAIPGPLQFRNLPDPEQRERLRQVIRAAAPELLHSGNGPVATSSCEHACRRSNSRRFPRHPRRRHRLPRRPSDDALCAGVDGR